MSFLPGLDFFNSMAMLTPWWMKSATCWKSDSVKPRLVKAGVPRRIPPGVMALESPGTVFLLVTIYAASKAFSTRAPSIPYSWYISTTYIYML